MEEARLLKLEAARDRAAAKIREALDDHAGLEASWPEHADPAVVEMKKLLLKCADAWSKVRDWAAQEIRGDAEKEIL